MQRLFILLILFGATFASAKPLQPVSDDVHEKNCRDLMKYAEMAMDAKQKGISLSKMLDINDKTINKQNDPEMHGVFHSIIMDAYGEPTYSSPTVKREQLNEYSAKYYLACMEMYK